MSQKLVCVLLLNAQAISIVSAMCETFSVNAIKNIKNDCLYPACSSDIDQWRCVHDSSFCTTNETFVSASDVLAAGQTCSCQDILDYPSLIGTCVTNGLYSPMLTDDDCTSGNPVCERSESNKFIVGDTEHPFTACDLKCASPDDEIIVSPSSEDEITESRVDDNSEGAPGGIVPGVVFGAILGFIVILVGGRSYLENKPNYRKPKFFPVEGDII